MCNLPTFGLASALALLLAGCGTPDRDGPHETSRPQTEAMPQMSGQVTDARNGAGVKDVEVQLIGTSLRRFTDENGRYSLPTRRGFSQIQVSHPDFITAESRDLDIRLWPHRLSNEAAMEILYSRQRPPMDHDDLSDPDLTDAARRILSDEGSWADSSRFDGRELDPLGHFKQGATPPSTIRIYRRGDENNSCAGRVDVIPLEEYVRGVLPHEWIPSWHHESLKAGSIVARSYAWGWILAGGKYDCADLDDTTRSQVYRDARNAATDAAIVETAGVGVLMGGAIVRSEYSAENGDPTEFGVNEPLCAGEEVFGHGRGLCQWGSQRWATQRGKDASWMIEHYYPSATATGGTSGSPQIYLGQRIQREDPLECVDPSGTYNCADFVRQGRSIDIFDAYIGSVTHLVLLIENRGYEPAYDVEYAVAVPSDLLEIREFTSDAVPLVFQTDVLRLQFAVLAAGEQKEVRLRLAAMEPTAGTGSAAQVHSWVSRIGESYRKDQWTQPPSRTGQQGFNGGDLKTLTEFDIFDPSRWRWRDPDPDLLEGWTISGGGSAWPSPNGLVINAEGETTVLDSPYLNSRSIEVSAVLLDSAQGAQLDLSWRGLNGTFGDIQRITLDEGLTELGGLAASTLALEQLRLQVRGNATIRELRLLTRAESSVLSQNNAAPSPYSSPDPPNSPSSEPSQNANNPASNRPQQSAGEFGPDSAENHSTGRVSSQAGWPSNTPMPPAVPSVGSFQPSSASGSGSLPPDPEENRGFACRMGFGTSSGPPWPALLGVLITLRRRRYQGSSSSESTI